MSEPFQLSLGLNPRAGSRSPNAFGSEFHLRLDPTIEAELAAIRARLDIDRLTASWLRPNWVELDALFTLPQLTPPAPSILPSLQPPLTQGTCGWSAPGPPNPGPDVARAATLSDVMSAVWKLPVTQCLVSDLSDEATSRWRRLGTPGQVMLVGMGATIVGGTLAGALQHDPTRIQLLDLISGVSVPVPGLTGLSARLYTDNGQVNGAGARFQRGAFDLNASSQIVEGANGDQLRDTRIILQLDLLKLIPRLQ